MQKTKTTYEFEMIELGEKVIVSDPCYKRDVWCMGSVDNVLPGKYRPIVTYSDEGRWGIRVSDLMVIHESVDVADLKRRYKQPFSVGVDSGQAGIFCNSIYPEGEIGEYGDVNTFYGQCCDATGGEGYESWENRQYLQRELATYSNFEGKGFLDNASETFRQHVKDEIERLKGELENYVDIPWRKAGIVQGKGIVSSSGFGDGGYTCYVHKSKGKVIAISIRYI